jgi:hypothetical protein
MKTAKAEIVIYHLNCPYCDGLLVTPVEGSTMFSIYESAPETAACHDCGEFSKVPKRVKGAEINIRKKK